MTQPLLTIGIPTYNRPESIQKTVRTLLPQLNENVVLRVWDNCSVSPVSDLFTEEEKKIQQQLDLYSEQLHSIDSQI